MNVLTVMGNLGRDANVRQAGGTTVANFSIAVKSGYGNNEQTVWVDCSLWGTQAESRLVEYLTQGQQVVVSGEMGTREYEGKTYITLRVNTLSLAGGRQDNQGGGGQQQRPQQQQQGGNPYQAPQSGGVDMDDDIPFAPLFSRNAYIV